jgi:hypothetical protein
MLFLFFVPYINLFLRLLQEYVESCSYVGLQQTKFSVGLLELWFKILGMALQFV